MKINKTIKYIPFDKKDIVFYPVIFWLKGFTPTDKLKRHAEIHLKQQAECLYILFFIIYGIDFLIKLVIYRDRELAYLNIGFEREAYKNSANKNYLNNRKIFSWIKYIYEGKK